jgi:hypothetical protein
VGVFWIGSLVAGITAAVMGGVSHRSGDGFGGGEPYVVLLATLQTVTVVGAGICLLAFYWQNSLVYYRHVHNALLFLDLVMVLIVGGAMYAAPSDIEVYRTFGVLGAFGWFVRLAWASRLARRNNDQEAVQLYDGLRLTYGPLWAILFALIVLSALLSQTLLAGVSADAMRFLVDGALTLGPLGIVLCGLMRIQVRPADTQAV